MKKDKLFYIFFLLALVIMVLVLIYTGGCIGGVQLTTFGVGKLSISNVPCKPPEWGEFSTFAVVIAGFILLLLAFILTGAIIVLPFYLIAKYLRRRRK